MIIDISHNDMILLSTTHVCGECGGVLSVAWVDGKYVLRCGNSLEHSTLSRHDTEYAKQITEIRKVRKLDSVALTRMSEAKMLVRVDMARFPQDLTLGEKKLLAQVAITYGLDPLMGEISIYQGRVFISIDGRYRKAQETNELDGIKTRPATKQDREDWGIPEGDYFFHADVWRKGASHPFEGWGRVRASETKPGSTRQGDNTSMFKPIQSNPQRMAEKRAEAQGLRKAFHIPLPSIEDIGSPEADAEPYIEAKVIEGEVKEVAEEETVTIETFADLYKVCNERFKMQPKDVIKELGVSTQADIAETPADCFLKIKEAKG